MPVEVGCPSCQSKLRVPEELIGRKVRCPQCRQAFQAVTPAGEGAAAPAPAAEEPVLAEVVTGPEAAATRPTRRPREAPGRNEDEPPKERGDARSPAVHGVRPGYVTREPGWQAVYQGLGTIGGGAMTAFAAVIIAVAGYFALNALSAGAVPDLPLWAWRGMAAAVFGLLALAVLAMQVGLVLCCAAPADGRSKRPAVTALVCLINAPILAYLSSIIRLPELLKEADWNRTPPHLQVSIAAFVGAVFGVLGLYFFVVSLRRIGRFFQDRRLTTSATILLGLIGLVLLAGIGAFIYDATMGIKLGGNKGPMLPDPVHGHAKQDSLLDFFGGTETLITAGVAIVVGLVVFFWFLEVVRRARLVIARAQREGAV